MLSMGLGSNNNQIYTPPYNFHHHSNNVMNNNGVTLIRGNHDYGSGAHSNSPTSRLVRNRMELNRGQNRLQGASLHKSLTKLHGGRPLTLPQQPYSKSIRYVYFKSTLKRTDSHPQMNFCLCAVGWASQWPRAQERTTFTISILRNTPRPAPSHTWLPSHPPRRWVPLTPFVTSRARRVSSKASHQVIMPSKVNRISIGIHMRPAYQKWTLGMEET